MNHMIELLRYTRKNIAQLISGLPVAQLNQVPHACNNNIIWNLGHMIYTQQSMCYRLGGLDPKTDMEYFSAFKPGSFPTAAISTAEAAVIKQQFLAILDDFETDVNSGLFKTYQPWSLHDQLTVEDIHDAMAITAVHEGRHYGVISSLVKLTR